MHEFANEPTIILLIGSPGTGKYTVAQAIAAQTGMRLVDNHSMSNVIFNLFEVDGVTPLPDGIFVEVAKVQAAVLSTLRSIAPRSLSYVFTIWLTAGEERTFDAFVTTAETRGSRFVPVLLSCETPELVQRVVSKARKDRMKLVNPVLAAEFNDPAQLFQTEHPNALRLDLTNLPVEDAVSRIVEWAKSRPAGT